jgi:HTH-type transcriptional regulator / antitoxin HigA
MTRIRGRRIANVRMTKHYNLEKYRSLLMNALPQVIETDAELERVEKIITGLLKKGENLSPEEDKLLDLLSNLVEDYEDEHYTIPEAAPNEVLKFLMGQNDLKQSDLKAIFSTSGIASEVINGKRSISKAQAKKLAEFFNVSVAVFI